jgi:hypothetical protein
MGEPFYVLANRVAGNALVLHFIRICPFFRHQVSTMSDVCYYV